jgi:hypothetical protein
MLAAMAGMANSGYFGIPLAVFFFGEGSLGVYLLAIFGFTLHECTFAFYLIFRSTNSRNESLRRLLTFPMLYACVLGVLLSSLDAPLPEPIMAAIANIRSGYVVFGMMLVGIGVEQALRKGAENPLRARGTFRFLGSALLIKFVLWPVIAFIVWHIAAFFKAAPPFEMMMMISLLPIAANAIAYSIEARQKADVVALSVIISTVISPIVLWFVYL